MNYIKISQKILIKFYNDSTYNLKIILNKELTRFRSSENSKITNIVYGVVRKERSLEFIISKLSKISMEKIDLTTFILLKTGLYLIFYTDSIPDYAIVNEIVKVSNSRSKNFINAVLRNSIRQKNNLTEGLKKSDLTVKYSITQELINNMKFLTNNPEYFLEYLNKEPVFHILENIFASKHKNKPDNSFLNDLNLILPLKTYELSKPEKIINSHIKNGQLYIQNTGSQIVSIIAAEYAKTKVLDCCAAPGTKSITIKNLSKDLNVIANDINYNRINLLNKKIYSDIRLTVSDMLKPAFKDNFDLILIDAPCSSAGTLRKSPDLKTKISKNIIEKNSNIQKDILCSIISNYNSNYFLYTVCSYTESETENVIEKTINNTRKQLKQIDLSEILNRYKFKYKRAEYGFYLLPDNDLNNDLFYISLLSSI